MVICEAALLTCLAALLCVSTVTDATHSIIPNKLLLSCLVISVIIDIGYYSFFADEYFLPFVMNLFLLTVVATILYCYHLWAAGDSKMLFVVGFCIPGRFYSFWDGGACASFVIILVTFSVAFVAIFAESIYLGIKQHNLFRISFGGFNWKTAIISYLFMVPILTIMNAIIYAVFGDWIYSSRVLETAISFVIVLSLIQLRARINQQRLLLYAVLAWLAVAICLLFGFIQFGISGNVKNWLLVLLVLVIRAAAEKYNYLEIPTNSVKKGQILSLATTLEFEKSRVHGLPKTSTEDLRSRLTEDEVKSILRWEKTANGKSRVVIVRKIPFAAFISCGTVAFVVLEVMMK